MQMEDGPYDLPAEVWWRILDFTLEPPSPLALLQALNDIASPDRDRSTIKSTLLVLTKTSRYFHRVAIPVLLRDVSLLDISPSKVRLLETMANNTSPRGKELGAYIHTLALASWDAMVYMYSGNDLWQRIFIALLNAVPTWQNLRNLHVGPYHLTKEVVILLVKLPLLEEVGIHDSGNFLGDQRRVLLGEKTGDPDIPVEIWQKFRLKTLCASSAFSTDPMHHNRGVGSLATLPTLERIKISGSLLEWLWKWQKEWKSPNGYPNVKEPTLLRFKGPGTLRPLFQVLHLYPNLETFCSQNTCTGTVPPINSRPALERLRTYIGHPEVADAVAQGKGLETLAVYDLLTNPFIVTTELLTMSAIPLRRLTIHRVALNEELLPLVAKHCPDLEYLKLTSERAAPWKWFRKHFVDTLKTFRNMHTLIVKNSSKPNASMTIDEREIVNRSGEACAQLLDLQILGTNLWWRTGPNSAWSLSTGQNAQF